MGRTFTWAVLGASFCFSASVACSDGSVSRSTDNTGGRDTSVGGRGGTNGTGGGVGAGGDGTVPAGQGVGDDCSSNQPCRAGLSCNSKDVCDPSAETQPGDACVISAECADGQCLARQCSPAGSGAANEPCLTDANCAAGLRCSLAGLQLACAPEGDGDLGAGCALSGDCFGGLACLAERCAVPPAGFPPLGQPWAGVECEPPVKEDEKVRAYFEVPGAAGADEGDFFRLPFPNDVRRRGGKLDLSGFPTPGGALLGIDPVQLYVEAVSESDSGWGTYPSVLFRFSGTFDFDTFGNGLVHFVDVTDPAKARTLGWSRFYTTARTNYVCENFVAVQPGFGSPLEPGHTYAVWLSTEFTDENNNVIELNGADGTPITPSENLADVLGDAVPSDAKLKAAHAAFAPMRAYLEADPDWSPSSVLTATVFTVGPVRDAMADVAAAVEAGPAPVADSWVKCGGAAESPCLQAEGDRACGAQAADYDEYHALLSLPVFQQGTAPYLTPKDGGGIDTSQPRTEEVCLAITVPKGAPPTGGWPAVVFGHGTGGSFRSHARDEVAGVLATSSAKFAVLGIDQVQHGPRRGDSTESPNNLFFNFLNPAATRGNPLQGAADQLSVARFAATLNVAAADTGGSAIKLDGSQLFFFGHSQGSTEGSLMLPYGDAFKAAVLSGNGASLKDALRTKTQPENIAAVLPIVLQDPAMTDENIGPGVTANHPVLSLLQHWIDPADPLNFAALIGRPLAGHTGKDIFQTFGIGDTYSPPVTMATFAVAAGLEQVLPHSSAKPPYDEGELPGALALGLSGNVGTGNTALTLGLRQYGAPKGGDGHFVVFDVKAANDDMVLFLTGAAGTTPPVVGQ